MMENIHSGGYENQGHSSPSCVTIHGRTFHYLTVSSTNLRRDNTEETTNSSTSTVRYFNFYILSTHINFYIMHMTFDGIGRNQLTK